MSISYFNMRVWAAVLAIFFLVVVPSIVAAIPESDLYYFRGSSRATFEFDSYYNGSAARSSTVKAFHNMSSYYYIVIRANAGDAKPHDKFTVDFKCTGDAVNTFVTTTDYSSWVESGQVSMKRSFLLENNYTYDGLVLTVKEATCTIVSAGDLVPDNNIGYTTFNVELVPLLTTTVITLENLCEDEARKTLIENEVNGTVNVVTNNINIFYTFWLFIQIVAIVFIFIGIPAVVLLLIRWTLFKISGRKILWGGNQGNE